MEHFGDEALHNLLSLQMYKILQHFPPLNSFSFQLFNFTYIALIDYKHWFNDNSLQFLSISVRIYLLVVKGDFFRWGHKNRGPFYSRCPSLLKGPCCRAEAKHLQLFIDNGDVSLWAKYSRKGRLTTVNQIKKETKNKHSIRLSYWRSLSSLFQLLVFLLCANYW